MDNANYTQRSSWSTDDKRFTFYFKLNVNESIVNYGVEVSLRFTSFSLNQKLLWDNIVLVVNDPELVFFDDTIDIFCIKGTLKAFTERNDKNNHLIIWGDFHHGVADNLFHFTGPMAIENIYTPTPAPPPIPQPIDPIDPIDPRPDADPEIAASRIITDSFHDLFPFIYLSNWPGLEEQEKNFGFVEYEPTITSPPTHSFYDKLLILKKSGNRIKLEEEAVKLITNQAPYIGVYISNKKGLTGKIAQFPFVHMELEKMEDYPSLLYNICQLLNTNIEELYLYLKSTDYTIQKEKLWQSYFALIIKIDYSPQWLNTITRILITCNLLEQLFFNTTEDIDSVPFKPEEIRDLTHANIILPECVFPLPPYPSSPPTQNTSSWVRLYALGYLQLVKQKLLRYEAGEIANIVSIMPGEKKENTKRKLQQENNKTHYSELNENINTQNTQEKNSDLTNEVLKTLAKSSDTFTYTDYSTNYGAPTSITLNGKYTVAKDCTIPETLKASKFAKKIINETSANIHKQVSHQRVRMVNHEQEDTTVSILDNTGNNCPVYGTYYWVNKVYEARLINCGNRLMLSFLITNPSSQYIKAEFNFKNEKLIEPKSPATLFQIFSFNDITTDNYTKICTTYNVEEYELPPDNSKIVSGILEGNESKFIEIPKGYEANLAYVSYISNKSEKQWAVNGMVGRQEFNFTGTTGTFTPLKLSKEDIAIPISATCNFMFLSPPAPVNTFRINIEVECYCSNRLLSEWKKKIYTQIMLKYKEQRVEYYNELNANTNFNRNSNPLYQRKTIKKEFKKACIKQLIAHMVKIQGVATTQTQSEPANLEINKLGSLSFFNNAIEWNEMTYCLLEDFGDDLEYSEMENISQEDEDIFNAFLQAEAARIIVPVWPGLNHSIIYFLATGSVWSGKDKLAPILKDQTSLVYKIKHLKYYHEAIYDIPECWEFKVPTSLQLLSNRLNLDINPDL